MSDRWAYHRIVMRLDRPRQLRIFVIASLVLLAWAAPTSGVVVSADTSSTTSADLSAYRPPPTSTSYSPSPSSGQTGSCAFGCATGGTTGPCPAASSTCLTVSQVPTRGVFWSKCTATDQVYCVESVTLRDSSGNEIVTSANPYANCHNNDMSSTEKCSLDGSDWMEMGVDVNSDSNSYRFTGIDITTYTYAWKVRTGKLEPDVLMMGDTQRVVVGGNASEGWTIEITAKPSKRAYASPPCLTQSTCATQVADHVTVGLSGYLRMLGVGREIPGMSVETESLRDALRGTFISTNGMSQSWSFSQDTFSVLARSPHFLPADSTGKSEVAPGFVRVFLPAKYIMFDRGYSSLSLVTADRVQLTVSGENATAKVTPTSEGILVDTGVEHFSAPDPTLRILKMNEISRIRRGVPVALSKFATPKATAKPKWSVKGSCKIVGKTIVATASKGTCSLTLQTLNAKKIYVTSLKKTLKVS